MPSLHQVFAASAILLALPLSQNVLTNAYPSAWRPQPQVYNEDAMLSVPHEDPLPALLLSRDVPAVVVDINEREANPAPKPDATEDKRAARPQATDPSIGDKAGHGGGKREADPAPRPDATEGKRAAGPQPTEDPATGDKAGHGGGKREADPAPRPDATEGKRAAGPQPTEDPATGDKAGHGGGKREAEPLPESDAIEGKRAAEPESTQ